MLTSMVPWEDSNYRTIAGSMFCNHSGTLSACFWLGFGHWLLFECSFLCGAALNTERASVLQLDLEVPLSFSPSFLHESLRGDGQSSSQHFLCRKSSSMNCNFPEKGSTVNLRRPSTLQLIVKMVQQKQIDDSTRSKSIGLFLERQSAGHEWPALDPAFCFGLILGLLSSNRRSVPS